MGGIVGIAISVKVGKGGEADSLCILAEKERKNRLMVRCCMHL